MQTLKRLTAASVITMVGITLSCVYSHALMCSSRSSNGAHTVAVILTSRLPMPRSGFRVVLSTGTSRHTLYQYEAPEPYPCFAEIVWSDDCRAVGIFVRDCWHSSMLLAFDVESRARMDPIVIRDLMRRQLRSRYNLPPFIVDPISWAEKSDDARRAFVFGRTY